MKIKEEKGITGIDITISIILITIFVAFIANLTYSIQKNSAQMERKMQATSYAIEIIEDIKSKGFSILPKKEENTQKIATIPDGYITDLNGNTTTYYRTITVEDYNELNVENADKASDILKKVTVEVSYKVGNSTESVELSTMIAKEN